MQAYINHSWCRDLKIRISKEQELFQGLARLHCDTFNTEPVLLLSQDCNAAGILLSSQQEKQLVTALQVRGGLRQVVVYAPLLGQALTLFICCFCCWVLCVCVCWGGGGTRRHVCLQHKRHCLIIAD
jgi:hypothetical protein